MERPTTDVTLVGRDDGARVIPVDDPRNTGFFDIYLLLTEAPDDLWKGMLRKHRYFAAREVGVVFISVTSTPDDGRPAIYYCVADLDLAKRVAEKVKEYVAATNEDRAKFAEFILRSRSEQVVQGAEQLKAAAALEDELKRLL